MILQPQDDGPMKHKRNKGKERTAPSRVSGLTGAKERGTGMWTWVIVSEVHTSDIRRPSGWVLSSPGAASGALLSNFMETFMQLL